ncbi:MAG: hypothetical protein WC884_04225 [Candidatus Paceibacterota bacterium]
MKCPYNDCRKDYNDESWPKVKDTFIDPSDFGGSINDTEKENRIYLVSRRCRFCNRLFHEIFVGHGIFDKDIYEIKPELELLVTYPVSKTKFESKNIPQKILDTFNEAERCRSVGSLTGTGGCLRKSVYTLCDLLEVTGSDYREKIGNLPVKDMYKELLKHIKWIGDNTTKPGEEKYTMKMLDLALEILPVLIDDIYLKDERINEANRLLAKVKSTK